MPAPENTKRIVCDAVPAQIGVGYTVVGPVLGPLTHAAGRAGTLPYRAEATFDAATAITGATFKLQVSRTTDGDSSATDARWTDLALRSSAAPAAAPAVEWAIAAAAGTTVALDLFSADAHRGRARFRVLVKKSGGGAAAGADAFRLYGPE